ncbi:MAG: hypothetical protein PUC11_07885 [Elusimicrobia bacterium]|nr:hypothetical protein [Elusimicrobiota bacterium]
MNKTWTCAGLLLLLACPLFANTGTKLESTVTNKVNAAVATNKGAITKNLRVDFAISEEFYDLDKKQYHGPFDADIACKAYALDAHWLILSGTCMRYDEEGDIFEPGDHEYMWRGHRTFRKHYNHAENGHVMLMWTDKPVYNAPFVNVLATLSPRPLFTLSATHTIKINTARYGSNAVRTRKLKTGSVYGNYFKLDEDWTDLSGTATDPLFVISPEGNEFLAAYNNGYIGYALQMTGDDIFHTFDGRISDKWFALHKVDLDFIKKTVQEKRPQDWARIRTRLFLNTTDKPFFSE